MPCAPDQPIAPEPPDVAAFMTLATSAVAAGRITWEQLRTLLGFDEQETRVLAALLDTGRSGTVADLIDTVALLIDS
jgi:hypothetical protein